ncbi:NAD(P)H-dependent glycerol-3-phosphate dehydrogenase [Quadrisphaera sp. DSM 44207]|uniref:NAD(P)H-dependent glycerol-3-phosphate dehydrogenase n=1 Tax=Quadrisphaera sp. DSM 44207 TaxID=1881057 RepID=UPI00088546EB|nr:NAD(P)H-dependent glycerol-3-phosphate dehydrogenase [Quadrisphaera sp. DSM 44207]SDQ75288.1 glycerol 3-phosphate dehydrogenase (NAD(P)+) [Quadrisphaera sp. DSM 44207]
MRAAAARRVAVLGAGSWGTTFAQVLADASAHARVVVWGRRAEVVSGIAERSENPAYLPGVRLPAGVTATRDAGEALEGADLVVLAVPVQQLRATLARHAAAVPPGAVVVSLLKGLEAQTHLRVTQVVEEVLRAQPHGPPPVAVVSGPNLAREIAERRPTATVVAAADAAVAAAVARACSTSYFRPFTSQDVVGVEVAGAVKNLLAVAVGLSEGLGLGDNAKASVMARGLAETTRLVMALGGSAATVAGLAGAGDAFATCASNLSRNHRLGVGLSRGERLEDVLAGLGGTAEAVATSRSVTELAAGVGVAMPVVEQVTAVLHRGRHPREAAALLLSRPVGPEAA